jgi:hypothetical protein
VLVGVGLRDEVDHDGADLPVLERGADEVVGGGDVDLDRLLAGLQDLVHAGLVDVLADPDLVVVVRAHRRGGRGERDECQAEHGDGEEQLAHDSPSELICAMTRILQPAPDGCKLLVENPSETLALADPPC